MINCKVELKLKWTSYCVFSAAGGHNAKANPNNIIFTIRDTKLYVPVLNLSAKIIRDYQKFLAKDLNDQFIGMKKKKQKGIIYTRQMNLDTFSNQILLESIDYLF